MDPIAFDSLTRAFQTAASRRRLLRLGSALLPAGLLAALLGEATEAGRHHRRSLRNRRHSGNNKQNRKGKRKGQDQDQDTPQTQNCADAKINCYETNKFGECGALVHQFGPVGRCWHIDTGCCPCDHRDYAYWENLCNNTSGACEGKCIVQDEGSFTCFGFFCPPGPL